MLADHLIGGGGEKVLRHRRRRREVLAEEVVFGGGDDKIFPMLFRRVFRRYLALRQTLDALFSQNYNPVFLLAHSYLFMQKFS